MVDEVTREEAKKPPTICTDSPDEIVMGGGANVCSHSLSGKRSSYNPASYSEGSQIAGHALDLCWHLACGWSDLRRAVGVKYTPELKD